jgi:hypothetical protein
MEAFMAHSLADFSAAQTATAKQSKTAENNFFIFVIPFEIECAPEAMRSQRRSGTRLSLFSPARDRTHAHNR